MALIEAVAHSSVVSARPTTLGFGKCTATLRTLVPDEIKDEFLARAKSMGYASESDCLRELLIVWLRGAAALQKIHADRIGLLANSKAETEQETEK